MRRVALLLVVIVVSDMIAAAQVTGPHPPVVRLTRDITQPRATVLAVDADASGNIYVTGYSSGGLATTPDVFQPTLRGGTYDAFAAKLDGNGALVWATYLGGSGGTTLANRILVPAEMGTSIKVDAAGNVYVIGNTPSRDFPMVNAFQSAPAPSRSGFVVKLDAAGRAVYSSYVGGSAGDASASRIAVTSLGEAYVAGQSAPNNFPGSRHVGTPSMSDRDFVVYIGPAGQPRDAFTFGGSSGADAIRGAAVDATGALHLVGRTASIDFPMVSAVQPTCMVIATTCSASFVMKFAPMAGPLAYSTYLDDPGSVFAAGASAVATDSRNRAVVVGSVQTSAFPGVRPLQPFRAGAEGFITRFTPTGAIDFSTTMGGIDQDAFDSVRVDLLDAIVVGGSSASVDFPVRAPLFDHPDPGVVRSDDGGTTWARVSNSAGGEPQRLVVDPVDPQRMYATWVEPVTDIFARDYPQRSVLARSDDGGRTWTRLSQPGPQPVTGLLAVSPSRSVYLSNGDITLETLRRSDDGGQTWTTIDQETCCGVSARQFQSIAFTRADPNRVYVATQSEGVRISTDRGATWVSRSSGLPQFAGGVQGIASLVASPVTVGTLWAVSIDTVFRTTDDGQTWTPMFRPISNRLAISADGSTLYAGDVDGVLVSTDHGATWRHSVFGFKNTGNVPRSVFTDPRRPSVVYALGVYQVFDVWKSADAGQMWVDVTPKQFARPNLTSLIFPPTATETVIGLGGVNPVRVLVRLTSGADDTPAIDTSTFLGLYGVSPSSGLSLTVTTIAPDGDVIVFAPPSTTGTAFYTLTRIGRWFPPLCGRFVPFGVLSPQVDVCAP